MPQRFFRNAPGDFYIVDGCCLACGVMNDVALSLIDWHKEEPSASGYGSWHCYVAQQPRTPVEMSQMLEAFDITDLNCLRYGGDDPGLLAALVERGQREQCDHFGPGDYSWLGGKSD